MPVSSTHEALVDLFRCRTTLAWEVARARLPSLSIPTGPIEIRDRSFAELRLPEYAADLALDAGEGPLLVVEVQLEIDEDKTWTWPLYAATFAHRHRRPVVVLVVALTERVATWARRRVLLAPRLLFAPEVVGPKTMRTLLRGANLSLDPELAVLAAVLCAKQPEAGPLARKALLVARTLDDDRARIYADLILAALPRALRSSLESLMLENYVFQSDFARKYIGIGREEGREEGRLEGRREMARALLNRRFPRSLPKFTAILGRCTVAELDWLAEELVVARSGAALLHELEARLEARAAAG